MDGTSPESMARRVNAQDVNCVPWSLCMTVEPRGGRRPSMAIPRALVTHAAVGDASMDQPTTWRENTSRTTAQ